MTKRPFQLALVSILALLTGGLFVGMNLFYNGGVLSAPLDDVFIHLQYGRQIGEGQWFNYNDSDPVSTGASSFLYVLILGGARFIGFDGNALLGFALLFGVALLVVTAVLGRELGRRLCGEGAGTWAGVLIATNGVFLWGATGGMEISLLAALFLGTLAAFAHELSTRRFILTPVLGALTALTRMEGLIFAGVIVAAILVTLLLDLRRRRLSPVGFAKAAPVAMLPVFAGALLLLFYRITTGTSSANGMLAKSLLNEPVFYPTEFLHKSLTNLTEASLRILMGFKEGNFLFPGALLFCVIGLVYLAVGSTRFRTFGVAAGIALALSIASISTLSTWDWNHYRYFLPFFPLVLVFAVIGFYTLGSRELPWLPVALASFALLFSLLGLPKWAVAMGGNSSEIHEQQVSIGYWIKDNLPPGGRIGINDAGAMRYYGGHPTVDLIGLTTNGLALPTRNGIGSLYEALERMPEDKRPDYFSVYPSWLSGLQPSGVFGREIKRFSLSLRPDLPSIVGGNTVILYEASWRLANSGNSPVETGGEVKDSLDVAELKSEEEHDYEMKFPQVGLKPDNVLVREFYPGGKEVADAGWSIPGTETFTISNIEPGRPVEVVMRTTGTSFDLDVMADGKKAGTWSFKSPGSGWHETSFTVPADLVKSGDLQVELRPPKDTPVAKHTAFHYWFIQI